MQPLDSFYETALRRGHHIVGTPLLIAEWNYNQLFVPIVTNPPDDQNWTIGKKLFPVESVTEGNRPTSGITAAFTDQALTSSSDNSLGSNEPRYYTSGEDDLYKYWICPTPSGLSKSGSTGVSETDDFLPDEYDVERGVIIVEYPEYLNVNKVSLTFNLGPLPVDWSVFLHTQGAPGDGYIEVTDLTVDPITGKCEIWWNGSAWVEDQELDESIFSLVDKVKLEVRTIDQPERRLEVITVAAGREIDISHRMVSFDTQSSMDSVDFIHPVGTVNANDGSIVLNNYDLKINEDDPAADLHGLTNGWCQFRIYVQYDLSDYEGGTPIYRVATLYANDFQQTNEYEYEIELFDVLKLLQTITCPAFLFENVSLSRILAQLLDSVGIDTYRFNASDFDDSNLVKYFWTDGTSKVFDVIDDLCKAQQCAVFVDELGMIQLITREDITDEDDDPVWTFRGEKIGDDLADIVSLAKKYSLQANEVTIKYKQMEANVDALDITSQPLTSKIWESSDTIVLRAAPLVRVLTSDGLNHPPSLPDNKDVWIKPKLAANWQYTGKVNIDGEVIEYDGKGYVYWEYTGSNWVAHEVIIKSSEEKRKWDLVSWNSFDPPEPGIQPGQISWSPNQQNDFSGRLAVVTRDSDNAGRQIQHNIGWQNGWMGLRASNANAGVNPNFPTRYVDPGGSVYDMDDLKDDKNRPNWTTVQSRWSVGDSVLTCDNRPYPVDATSYVLIRDLGGAEFREFGGRIKLDGEGVGGLIFYMSDAVGYDNENPTLTDPLLATRWYRLNILCTEHVEKFSRGNNEIAPTIKEGSSEFFWETLSGASVIGAKHQIDRNKWYDIDVVFKDAGDTEGTTYMEVFIDGSYVETFYTRSNIRPTGLMGLYTGFGTKADFEHFYATTTSTNINPKSLDDEKFDFALKTLPPGTNETVIMNLAPVDTLYKQGMISLASTDTDATLSSVKMKSIPHAITTAPVKFKEVGPILLKPNTKVFIEIPPGMNMNACEFKYTATQDISVCVEYTAIRNYQFGVDRITPSVPDNYIYVGGEFGFLSTKADTLAYMNLSIPAYSIDSGPPYLPVTLFFDDFGAVAREVRDFDVEYDTAPAKGVRLFLTNEKVRIVEFDYNPNRGKFTLVNVSFKDEIINGTEEVDDSNSIDHSMMLHGYVIVDKGDKTKVVKDDLSIRRHGKIAVDLDANWLFNEDDATTLGDWIVEHWSEPMDTLQIEVFSNTFSQIGDKVNIEFSNAGINSDWLYIVSEISRSFDNEAFNSKITIRRVR
jgi:hypothetical protein